MATIVAAITVAICPVELTISVDFRSGQRIVMIMSPYQRPHRGDAVIRPLLAFWEA